MSVQAAVGNGVGAHSLLPTWERIQNHRSDALGLTSSSSPLPVKYLRVVITGEPGVGKAALRKLLVGTGTSAIPPAVQYGAELWRLEVAVVPTVNLGPRERPDVVVVLYDVDQPLSLSLALEELSPAFVASLLPWTHMLLLGNKIAAMDAATTKKQKPAKRSRFDSDDSDGTTARHACHPDANTRLNYFDDTLHDESSMGLSERHFKEYSLKDFCADMGVDVKRFASLREDNRLHHDACSVLNNYRASEALQCILERTACQRLALSPQPPLTIAASGTPRVVDTQTHGIPATAPTPAASCYRTAANDSDTVSIHSEAETGWWQKVKQTLQAPGKALRFGLCCSTPPPDADEFKAPGDGNSRATREAAPGTPGPMRYAGHLTTPNVTVV